MTKQRRHLLRSWLAAIIASCIAVGLCAVMASNVASQDATPNAVTWSTAKTFTNRFAANHTPLLVAEPESTPVAATAEPASQASEVVGGEVDVDAPPVYRLPMVAPQAAADEPIVTTEPLVASPSSEWAPPAETPALAPPDNIVAQAPAIERPNEAVNEEVTPIPTPPAYEQEMQQALENTFQPEQPAADSAAHAIPYTPAVADLSTQLLPSVRKGYAMSQRGATYAAQTEFIQVLRRIAQARDAAESTNLHSQALANGLRALDEADDFAPEGAQLEAEMDVASLASSHRTPVLASRGNVPPHEAIALYHQYAQQQLAQAVAGEQAGSMALYGLGKIYGRLATESDGDLRHERKAMTMFLASLEAGPNNHLAANEVGVLLSRGGHQAEAVAMFQRAIDLSPSSTTYHNLAVAEQKLGNLQQSTANEQYAQQLVARDRATGSVSRSKGVEWVPPDEMARAGQPQTLPPNPAANRTATRPQSRSPIQSVFRNY